jgi:hypothetical protein
MPTLSAPCDITVVDFSQTAMVTNNFDNQGFIDFLEQPQDKWIKCRWININGLSWDVIQAVGRHKHLHKLALEDIMELKNRTKAEWCVSGLIYHPLCLLLKPNKVLAGIRPTPSSS